MRNRWFAYTAVVVGVIVIGLIARGLVRASEPSFQGQRLSEWLNYSESLIFALNYPNPNQQSTMIGAKSIAGYEGWMAAGPLKEAFRAMGTNAVPFLIRVLREKDSSFWAFYIDRWKTTSPVYQRILPVRLPANVRQGRALIAFKMTSQMMTSPNLGDPGSNRRPAFPLHAGRQFGRASYASVFVLGVVVHAWRWVKV